MMRIRFYVSSRMRDEFSETQINLLNEGGDIKVIDFLDDSYQKGWPL
jgi:hypothetical protein